MFVTFQLCTKALQAKQNAEEAGTTFLSPQALRILFVVPGLSLHEGECQQCLLYQHKKKCYVDVLHHILALMQLYIYTLCFAGRQIIPTEHKHAGQNSKGLDKGTRELMWGKNC